MKKVSLTNNDTILLIHLLENRIEFHKNRIDSEKGFYPMTWKDLDSIKINRAEIDRLEKVKSKLLK